MQSNQNNFPTIPQAALLLLATVLLQYLVWAALYDVRRTLNLPTSQLQALVMVLANGILLVSVMQHRQMSYRDLVHPSKTSFFSTAVLLIPPVLLLVPLMLLLNRQLFSLLQWLLPLFLWEEQALRQMHEGSLAAVVAVCVLAPVLEEMLFRGVLLRSFLDQHPKWMAISVSALLFGVAHLNVYQFVLAFVVGLLLGWLFERSRSLIPCIALHAAFNTATVVLHLPSENQITSAFNEASVFIWLLSLVAGLLGAWILYLLLSNRANKVPIQTA